MEPDRGPIGRRLKRLEDGRLLRGEGTFVDDLRPEGCLAVAFLRSPLASARIHEIHVTEARSRSGVVAAFAAADLAGSCAPLAVHLTTAGARSPARPIFAVERVRFSGELVAAAVASDRYAAADAVELIHADLAPLEAVTTCGAALADGAPAVHDSVPGNLYFVGRRSYGDTGRAFDGADAVIEGEVIHPRVSPAPLECRGVLAEPVRGGGVTVWTSTQVPHLVAEAVAECLGLERTHVRVVATDAGGGFGIKAQVYPEEIALAWMARCLEVPVKWIETRSEHMHSASHARDQRVAFSAAVRNDGRLLGLRARIYSNVGAYGIRPFGPLLDPLGTAGLIPGPYELRDYEYETYAVATNCCPEGPYRGVGMVTAALVHERLMELIARRLHLDPAEVRRANFIPGERMPYAAVTGHPYESGDYRAALDRALTAFDYETARQEQARARANGRLCGVGIGSYVEYTGAGSRTFTGRGMTDIPGTDTARIWVAQDGSVHVQTTCPSVGQGSHTTLAQVAGQALGLDPAAIVVEQTDTAQVAHGTGSFMSRGSVTAATSTFRAAGLLREAILEAAAGQSGRPIDRLSLETVPLATLAAAQNGDLDVSVTYDPVQAAHPYATHVCLVDVDPETGAVRILRYVVAEDCGVLINPTVVEGQVVGGIAQGTGGALMEEVAYGEEGQLLTGSFLDYLVPSIGETARAVEIVHLVTPSTVHELGTKGAGEGGTIGSTAALANAVADALGLDDVRLPLTPDRVVAHLRRAQP